MLDSAVLLIIANHLRDIYNQLSSIIIEAKSHRPTWKVTGLKITEKDPISGADIQREEMIVDKLTPLVALFTTLENAARGQLPIDTNI
mgnify:CR=1 FL=1